MTLPERAFWKFVPAALMACSSTPRDSGTEESGTEESVPGAPEIAAVWTENAQVEASLTNVLHNGLLLPLDLFVWHEGMMDEMADGAVGCPRRNPALDDANQWTSFWTGNCTGTTHTVTGDWLIDVRRESTETGVNLDAAELHSVVGEVLATGEPWYAGGHSSVVWEAGADSATFALFYGGSYLDPASAGPLRAAVSGGLSLSGNVDAAGVTAIVDGGMAAESEAIEMRDLTFDGLGGMLGEIRVRDPGTGWWSLRLDGDGSGCGVLSWGNDKRGATCAAEGLNSLLHAQLSAFLVTPP